MIFNDVPNSFFPSFAESFFPPLARCRKTMKKYRMDGVNLHIGETLPVLLTCSAYPTVTFPRSKRPDHKAAGLTSRCMPSEAEAFVFIHSKVKEGKKELVRDGFVRKTVLNVTDEESYPFAALFLLYLKTQPQALDSCILLRKEENFYHHPCMYIFMHVHISVYVSMYTPVCVL